MRLFLPVFAAFALAVVGIPVQAEAAGPVKTVAKGTATVGKGVARGTVKAGKGVARGTGKVAKGSGRFVCRVFTLGRRC
ncbi:MAG: hypothetical protein ACR2GC_03215 [Methyloceanibacter sp.]|uniref:hypothetical protein n=1 Tax=Methyloceanibacter sp. TaxID=1965321 RepID=UPI003D9B5F0C